MTKLQCKTDLPNWLARLGLSGHGVEVGVFQGEFSEHLLTEYEGGPIHLVDWWRYDPFGFPDHEKQEGQDQIFAHAVNRLRKWIDEGKAVVRRQDSKEAATSFLDESVDWVYIDAGHAFTECWADLCAWWPKIRKGGVLAGDDFGTPEHDHWHRVEDAVRSFAERVGCELFLTEDEQWWIRKQ